jgi:hypothetical protein
LHVVRPLVGGHDWWRDGARLRSELRTLDDRARVTNRLQDADPGTVHAWAAAPFQGEYAECVDLASRWRAAVQNTLSTDARQWTEILLGGAATSMKAQLSGLPGVGRPSTLARPVDRWTLPDPLQPRRLRLHWWSNRTELDHVSLRATADRTGTVVSPHEIQPPLRGTEVETLALNALMVDFDLPVDLPNTMLIDGTTGAPIDAGSSAEPPGRLLLPRWGPRLLQVS